MPAIFIHRNKTDFIPFRTLVSIIRYPLDVLFKGRVVLFNPKSCNCFMLTCCSGVAIYWCLKSAANYKIPLLYLHWPAHCGGEYLPLINPSLPSCLRSEEESCNFHLLLHAQTSLPGAIREGFYSYPLECAWTLNLWG